MISVHECYGVRPTLLHNLQVHSAWSKKWPPPSIESWSCAFFLNSSCHHHNESNAQYLHLPARVNFIFFFQAVSNNVELKSAPTIKSLLICGINTWVAQTTLSNLFATVLTLMDLSTAEHFWREVWNTSEVQVLVKVSPIWIVPWLCKPIIAMLLLNAHAHQPRKSMHQDFFTNTHVVHFQAFLVFKIRMNAIRSRCLGSMLAWIQNQRNLLLSLQPHALAFFRFRCPVHKCI